jgi:hypothetical protein
MEYPQYLHTTGRENSANLSSRSAFLAKILFQTEQQKAIHYTSANSQFYLPIFEQGNGFYRVEGQDLLSFWWAISR